MEPYLNKIRSLREMKNICDELKVKGGKIVFTNGCFDILHAGHTRYLSEARALGSHLIVGLNSDISVRKIKGQKRPIFPEETRAELLAALHCVDSVVLFDEDNPYDVIKTLLPDILVKGGDWAEDGIIGSDLVKAAGGQVMRIPFVDGFSTTGVIEKILGLYR